MSRNHIGEMAGIFKIVEQLDYKDHDGHALYKGICKDCNFERIARLYDLKCAKECTHIRVDGEASYVKTNWKNQRLKGIFDSMKQRCYNPNNKSYRWYGSKGVKICDEWMNDPSTFEEWSFNNGYSDDLTIDRIDGSGNYSPNNCRWITQINNAKYKSTTFNICVNGITHSGRDWANILGIGQNLVNKYINTYGLDNTIIFITKCLENPGLKPRHGQSYYDLYVGCCDMADELVKTPAPTRNRMDG